MNVELFLLILPKNDTRAEKEHLKTMIKLSLHSGSEAPGVHPQNLEDGFGRGLSEPNPDPNPVLEEGQARTLKKAVVIV